MYRPEGWMKKRTEYLNKNTMLALSVESKATYEAGADEYERWLKKAGRYITPATYIDYPPLIASLGAMNKKGYLVFIPEDAG